MGANSTPEKAGSPATESLLLGYLSHLSNERRLSPHTVGNYGRDIRALASLAGPSALSRLGVHEIRRFVAQLHARGLDGRSLARMLSAWRGFYHYLARDHGYSTNPCLGIRAPRAAKKLPKALSPDEAARLMQLDGEGLLVARDKAILELFYSSGLRLSELTGLAVQDLNLRDATVQVTGKGSKTRIVPVGRHALDALKAWLTRRDAVVPPGERALFVAKGGARMSGSSVQRRVAHWARKFGLSGRVHPHVLRHSFASHVLQSSGDLRAVQEMLGHASISTTQVYTHLDFQHLAKAYDAAHPRAKRKS
ncbi:MAG TPA: tyrosine recombinase XerC [Burkholderiales bacterium]|nr:tyrosine recombinase XerC [Burkholderiales bacterium]